MSQNEFDEYDWDDENDEELDANGDTEEEAILRAEYMEENFPNAEYEESVSDSDMLSMMDDADCTECGGVIETQLDTTEENLYACSSCGKEHIHCSTCVTFYDAFLFQCPNDH